MPRLPETAAVSAGHPPVGDASISSLAITSRTPRGRAARGLRLLAALAVMLLLTIALMSAGAATAHAASQPDPDRAGDGVGTAMNWEMWIHNPKLSFPMQMVLVFAGFIGIVAITMTTERGSLRAVLCLGVCIIFTGILDPKSFIDPVENYPIQIAKLQKNADLQVRLWGMGQFVAFVFVNILVLSLTTRARTGEELPVST